MSLASQRPLNAEEREEHLAWLALRIALRKRKLTSREAFQGLLDVDNTGSLSYDDFENGLQNGLPELNANEEALLSSLYTAHDTIISESQFCKTLRTVSSIHFPENSFAFWAGTTLLATRQQLRETALKLCQAEETKLLHEHEINSLRLKESELSETTEALSSARSKLSQLVSEKVTIVQQKREVDHSRHALDETRDQLERELADARSKLAAVEEGLRVTRGQLSDALQTNHRVQAENDALRLRASEDATAASSFSTRIAAMQLSLNESDAEIERLHSAAVKASKTHDTLVRANHVLELQLLRMEEARNSAIAQLIQQRVIEAPNVWWREKIDTLERKNEELTQAKKEGEILIEYLRKAEEASSRQFSEARKVVEIQAKELETTRVELQQSKRSVKVFTARAHSPRTQYRH